LVIKFTASATNGIEAGFKTLKQTQAEMVATLRLLPQLDSILFCPDTGQTCYRIYQQRPDALYDISDRYPYQNLKGTFRKNNY
jgi:hypothetical protein